MNLFRTKHFPVLFAVGVWGLGCPWAIGQDAGVPPTPQPGAADQGAQAGQDAVVPPNPQPGAADQGDQGASADPNTQTLTRGPIHEAFASPVTTGGLAPLVVPKQPPDPIEEVPPDVKPEGQNVVWINGYWAWDDDRQNFLWVSGVWRAPPPGQTWVAGYWTQAEGGSQWVPGFWTSVATQQVTYLPTPPESQEQGPTSPAPSDNYLWVPGCWVWRDVRFAWRPGYWAPGYPDWIWVPDSYCWTPRGWVFVSGHWDYPLYRRGLLYAPVEFVEGAWRRPGFHYTPSVVIDVNLLPVYLFCRPHYHHYYFGDYFAPAYARLDIYPWHTLNAHAHYRYDPLFVYYRWYNHTRNPQWEQHIRGWHDYFERHADMRPPHTLVAMRQYEQRIAAQPGGNQALINVTHVAAPVQDIHQLPGMRINLATIPESQRKQMVDWSHELRDLHNQRRQLEAVAAAKPGAEKPGGVAIKPAAHPDRVQLPKLPNPQRFEAGRPGPGVTFPGPYPGKPGTERPGTTPKIEVPGKPSTMPKLEGPGKIVAPRLPEMPSGTPTTPGKPSTIPGSSPVVPGKPSTIPGKPPTTEKIERPGKIETPKTVVPPKPPTETRERGPAYKPPTIPKPPVEKPSRPGPGKEDGRAKSKETRRPRPSPIGEGRRLTAGERETRTAKRPEITMEAPPPPTFKPGQAATQPATTPPTSAGPATASSPAPPAVAPAQRAPATVAPANPATPSTVVPPETIVAPPAAPVALPAPGPVVPYRQVQGTPPPISVLSPSIGVNINGMTTFVTPPQGLTGRTPRVAFYPDISTVTPPPATFPIAPTPLPEIPSDFATRPGIGRTATQPAAWWGDNVPMNRHRVEVMWPTQPHEGAPGAGWSGANLEIWYDYGAPDLADSLWAPRNVRWGITGRPHLPMPIEQAGFVPTRMVPALEAERAQLPSLPVPEPQPSIEVPSPGLQMQSPGLELSPPSPGISPAPAVPRSEAAPPALDRVPPRPEPGQAAPDQPAPKPAPAPPAPRK